MKNKIMGLVISLLALATTIEAQIAIHHQVSPPHKPDSVDISYYSKKDWLGAGVQVFGLNMAIWGFDRYALKSDFAYISINTIKDNIKHGFVWDNDQMGTNMFLHPYHGSLYYNSARSRGYGYWASGAFALGGSAMWELALENEYPSINDIIATPVGGLTLGEVFYRSSDLILDDRKTGTARFGREAAAFLISPTRGLTRIINGDAWKQRTTSGRQFGVPDISVEVSSGVRVLELKDKILDKGIGFATDINIEYGDKFDTDTKRPYDSFSLKANLNIHSSQPILSQLNIVGKLHSTELIDNELDFLSVGLYQHFDYYDSDTISDVSNKIPYKFCTPASFGIGFLYKRKRSKIWSFDAYTHLNTVLLGGTLSDHYLVDKRNYNLASGFSWKMGFNLAYRDKFSASASYEAYKMFTWKGYPEGYNLNDIDIRNFNYQGDKSQAILHAISAKFDLKLRKQLYLTNIFSLYTRDTNYKYFEDVFSKTAENRFLITYKF